MRCCGNRTPSSWTLCAIGSNRQLPTPCRAAPYVSAAPFGIRHRIADAQPMRSRAVALPAARTTALQPPSRIFLLTGPRGNGQSALVHLIAKDLPNCLHIRAGDLVRPHSPVDHSTGMVLWHRARLWSTLLCAHMVENCGLNRRLPRSA